MKKRISVAVLVGVCLCFGGILSASEKYRAKLFTRGGPNTESVLRIQINIESYTTGEEGWKLLQALNDQCWEPFITGFRQSNKGSVVFQGSRGLKVVIHVAQVIPQENGRKIMLFTERQAWEVDVSQRIDGRFPFMVFELDVDNKGRGDGKIYENAQIKLKGDRDTSTAIMEMESYNSSPKVLFSVELIK